MHNFARHKVYLCLILAFGFDIQTESVQCQYPISNDVICYNVHNITIQDSEIDGDINFEGIAGLLENHVDTAEDSDAKNQKVNIYCVNQYVITIINSVIHGNILVDGICRILEQENFK